MRHLSSTISFVVSLTYDVLKFTKMSAMKSTSMPMPSQKSKASDPGGSHLKPIMMGTMKTT